MATLTFSFDTGNVSLTRITDAMAVVYGYPANVPDPAFPNDPTKTIANPQTKAQFAKDVIKNIIVAAVREADTRTARATADASVSNISLT